MPLIGGRDFGTYLGAYVELFQSDPIDLGYVLGRTPIAPLVVGALLDPFGGALAELGVSALYGAAVTAWFLAARTFGGRAALAMAAVLLLYPSYAILFHELASDAVFAVAFALWSLLAVRVLVAPSPWRFAAPRCRRCASRSRSPGQPGAARARAAPARACDCRGAPASRPSAAFAVAAVSLLGLWTVHNGVRFGDYTVARGGNSRLPFERAFLFDRIVRPDNGPASRRLARAVETQLLPKEPYRSVRNPPRRLLLRSEPTDEGRSRSARQPARRMAERRASSAQGRHRGGPHPSGHVRTRRDSHGLASSPLADPAPGAEHRVGHDRRNGTGCGRTPSSSTAVDSPARARASASRPLTSPARRAPTEASTPCGRLRPSYHLVFVHAGDEERYDGTPPAHRRARSQHARSCRECVGRALPQSGVALIPAACLSCSCSGSSVWSSGDPRTRLLCRRPRSPPSS